MEMNGEHKINAKIQKVWEALNNPEILLKTIPGCETIEKVSENELTATVKAKIGPVSAKFKGKVTLSEINPPNSYTISGEGQGGAAGFGKGSAKVSLKENAEFTILSYSANAQVGGKLAQIGARLVDGAAKKIANEFFTNFANEMSPTVQEKTEKTEVNSDTLSREKPNGFRPFTWVSGLIIAILAILLLYYSI
ncbi:carbon monoxide dehydrogenase subunit G [Alphaproteobacteria bacterium]|nr:carbon monoxide dehydrogenase subunit G [Alphaproteobacteria bacterium]